jgi:hypothetical protein
VADFSYGISTFERKRGGFPALPIVNMLAEPVPTEPGVALQSRSGLVNSSITMGTGPIRGVFKADGVLNNGLFGVSDETLYESNTLVGTIDGLGSVSFAGYEDIVFVNAGGKIWKYDGASLTEIAFPDSANVIKIAVGASRLIAIREDTGEFYWSEPLGTTIDALAFATAENSPDTLKDMLFIGDRLILFGAETIEFWPITSDPDLPFSPLVGSVLPVGIKGTGMAALFNRTFAWVTNYNEICVETPDNIISEPELQTRIAASTSVSLWTFYIDDVEYLAITLDAETWVFGARTQVWSKFESYGATNWIPRYYDSGYFGSSETGHLIEWSDNHLDFGGVLERRFRGWAAITGGSVKVNNVVLRTNPGTTPYLSSGYTNPIVELRTSRDGGNTWQPWKSRSLGEQGQYRLKTFWNSLGLFSYPGVLVEVRVTDPVPFRISGLSLNEPFGGR